MHENEISGIIVDCCYKVHIVLCPGLLESVYEEALCIELARKGLNYERQKDISVDYDGVALDKGFRADVIVENKVLVEIKSVEEVKKVFKKTVLTYLKFTKLKLGLLVNFNVS